MSRNTVNMKVHRDFWEKIDSASINLAKTGRPVSKIELTRICAALFNGAPPIIEVESKKRRGFDNNDLGFHL